jgi:chromosome segregation ATPase
MVSESSKEV